MKKKTHIFFLLCSCLLGCFSIASKVEAAVGPLPSDKFSQIGDIRDYNGFIDGEHSADSADTEGPLIISGDSLFPNDTLTFTFGASFRSDNTTVGTPLYDSQVVNVLTYGAVKNYSNAVIAFEESSDNRGWVIGNENIDSWLTPQLAQEIALPYYLEQPKLNTTLGEFRSRRNELVAYVEKAVSQTGATDWETLNVWGANGQIPSIPIRRSNVDSKILVIDLDNVAEFQRGSNALNINGIGLSEELIQENSFDSVVIKSTKEKIVFSGGTFTDNGELSLINPLAATYAQKTSYYFPNATQITNYSDNMQAGTPPTLPPSINGKNRGVDLTGEDLYKNINDQTYGAATIGSVLAPKATVVYSGGNVNGLILVKDFHQRDGAELHNFRANWLEQEFELDPKGSLLLVKQTIGSQGQFEKLSDAKFILYKEVAGEKQYYSFSRAIGFEWFTNREAAYIFSTNTDGEIFVSGLDIGTYYMEEVEAPAGHELLTNPIAFTINETDVLVGKPVAQQVINQKTPLIDIVGQKTWKDNENAYDTRPDFVIIELYQNNEKISEQRISSASDWRYEFLDLPQFDDEGTLYIYTVKEVAVPGYETVVSRNGSRIMNILKEKFALKGNKIWLDDGNASQIRPDAITVELFQNNVRFPIAKLEVTAANNWAFSFDDLEKYDLSGRLINYRIVETPVSGYQVSYSRENNDIINKIQDTINLQGQKTWDDNNNSQGLRPDSIVVELLQNGVSIRSATVTVATNWQYEFTDLEKYDELGVVYTYTIRERPVSGYKTSYDVNGLDVTNKIETTETSSTSSSTSETSQESSSSISATSETTSTTYSGLSSSTNQSGIISTKNTTNLPKFGESKSEKMILIIGTFLLAAGGLLIMKHNKHRKEH